MRRWVMLLGVATTASVLVFACSEDAFFVDGGDAGDAEPDRAAPPPPDATMEDAPIACEPHAFSGPTRYVPPRPWHQDACNPMQVEGFLTACRGGTSVTCDAYASQNPTCFGCAVTAESERSWGAFVVFEGGYFNLNVTGCVANALGDLSDEGCGAARGRLRHCGERSCRGCLPVSDTTSYQAFEACIVRDEAAKICDEELAAYTAKCAGHLDPKPTDPTYPCFGVGLSEEALFRYYLTAFCTAEVDAGDAATD